MPTIPCSECKSQFPDLFSFRIHFQISHQDVQRYACVIDQCDRKFNDYYSFRKHATLIHHALVINSQASEKPKIMGLENNGEHFEQISEFENLGTDTTDEDVHINVRDLLIQEEDYLVSKLYSNPAFPRNLVNDVINNFTKYLTSPFFEKMQQLVISSLDPNLSSESKQEIARMFDSIMQPFSHLQTEYKRLKYFESSGDYIPPESYEIYSREERVKTKDGVVLQMRKVTGEFIPLRKVFTKFFHLPHVLEDTMSYMQSLVHEKDWLFNLVQCEVWQRKLSRFEKDAIVIPLNVYYDEVEPNNSLGPHCEPLGCTYVQIVGLPPEWNSRLENIFLALLFNSDDRSIYGNKRAFKPLLKELKFLEKHGIFIETKNRGQVRVYIVVALVLGDNKGIQAICGFMEGFTATHFCRICHITKAESEHKVDEDLTLLRTPENYFLDVARNDPTNTGVKEKCVFDKLPSFQAPTDISVDEFHDLIEGVAHYTMVPVLKHFNNLNRMFLPTLNSRLYSLDLGIDNGNRPQGINVDRLTKKNKLKMTGAEMYTFVRVFGLLVLDMVPERDPYYQLYLLLHDVMSIVHSKSLPRDAGVILSVLVKEHHKLYMELTGETLKPKHHFLVHYCYLLLLLGPFGGMSTIRFEAKHRLLKHTSNTCMSRVNLAKTVAIKQQLGFCFRCVSNASIRQPLIPGPSEIVNLSKLDMFASVSLSIPDDMYENPIQPVLKWVEFKGTKYSRKQILLVDVDEDGLFQFGEIELILIHEEEPLFICSALDTVGYFSEVRAYEVMRYADRIQSWFAVPHSKLLDHHPLCLYSMPTGETVIVLRNHL